jgi:hypothetical protein
MMRSLRYPSVWIQSGVLVAVLLLSPYGPVMAGSPTTTSVPDKAQMPQALGQCAAVVLTMIALMAIRKSMNRWRRVH